MDLGGIQNKDRGQAKIMGGGSGYGYLLYESNFKWICVVNLEIVCNCIISLEDFDSSLIAFRHIHFLTYNSILWNMNDGFKKKQVPCFQTSIRLLCVCLRGDAVNLVGR